jgi:hypothetical protein
VEYRIELKITLNIRRRARKSKPFPQKSALSRLDTVTDALTAILMWVRHHSNEAVGTSATVESIVQSVALDVHLTHSPCLLISEDLRGLDHVRHPHCSVRVSVFLQTAA